MEQVFVNLIRNCCEAVPDNQKSSTNKTMIGSGSNPMMGHRIAPEELSKIMGPYPLETLGNWNTGLRMSVASMIIQDHNGMIDIASEPGKGTNVTVSLPAKTKNNTTREEVY
jgi:nitrogen-specific signal transduction histidine kinase